MSFDVIVVGHVAIDVNVFPWGVIENVLGGAPTYSGLTFVNLKRSVGISSKVGLDFLEKFPPIYGKLGLDTAGIIVAGEHTTTFQNIYDESGRRTQICKHMAPRIIPEDIPEEYMEAAGFYVSPIANEVGPELLQYLKKNSNLVMLDPQGILREIAIDGKVSVKSRDLGQYLKHVDVVKLGMDEAAVLGSNPEESMEKIMKAGPGVVILTKGGAPSFVMSKTGLTKVNPLKVVAKDMTGAGDVFGAAFLHRFMATRDAVDAAKFGTAAAGLKIRFRGPVGFSNEKEIEDAAKTITVDQ
ncbi:MAG: carbohydrate kinase family protein [Candidatus Hadarchaeales archaeon]